MRYIRICVTLLGLLALSSCDVEEPTPNTLKRDNEPETKREKVEKTYLSQVGIREETGRNDGPQVEAYLETTGIGKGNPWCAAFVNWVLKRSEVSTPNSAWSPDWFKSNVILERSRGIVGNPRKGDVFGIYFQSMGRVAHVGFVHRWGEDWVETVEGNSNDNGSRDGDGVYRKKRLRSQIYVVSDWVKE